MLMRPLMLNPRRKPAAALPPTGHYWQPSGTLVRVIWDAALNRLTFEPTTSVAGVRPSISNAGYIGLHSDTFPRRLNVHQINANGVVNPAVLSHLLSGLPSDWSIVSMLANGEILQQKGQLWRVTNLVTGQIGPELTGFYGYLPYGDGFVLLRDYDANLGAGASQLLSSTDTSSPGTGQRLRINFDAATDEETATPLVRISSTGAVEIPFTGLPWAGPTYAGAQTRIRLGRIAAVSMGFARSGAMLAFASGTLSEIYTNSPEPNGSVPISVKNTRFAGLLRVSASGAILVPTSIVRRFANVFAVCPAQDVFKWNDGTDWSETKYASAGDPDLYDLRGAFGTVISETLKSTGVSPFARIRAQQGGAPVFDLPYTYGTRICALPHIGALLGWTHNANPGVARISFDYGQTWQQIATWRASFVGQAPVADWPPDLTQAVPLFPYAG